MFRRIELYCLSSTISWSGSDYAFTSRTRQAITTTIIALATMIEIVCDIMDSTITINITKAFAVSAVKTVATGITTGTAVINISQDIGEPRQRQPLPL